MMIRNSHTAFRVLASGMALVVLLAGVSAHVLFAQQSPDPWADVVTNEFPKTKVEDWVWDYIDAPIFTDAGFWEYSYAVWESQTAKDNSDAPFLLNSHESQFRETHQRIKTNVSGEWGHVSGAYVDPLEVEDFFSTDSRAYNWVGKDSKTGEWIDESGKRLLPYEFDNYWGEKEELDPQWVREQFSLPIIDQIGEAVNAFLKRAEQARWSGDRRGTTVNKQVGADADDAYSSNGTERIDKDWVFTNLIANSIRAAMRFQTVNIASGSTIDNAQWSIYCYQSTYDDFDTTVYAEDADSGSEPESVDIDSLPLTTANYAHQDLNVGEGAWSQTAANSLDSVIQEVIDRGGWSANNHITILTYKASGGSYLAYGRDYQGNSSQAAKLDIDYTEGAAAERRIIIITSLLGIRNDRIVAVN